MNCIQVPEDEQTPGFQSLTTIEEDQLEALINDFNACPRTHLYHFANRYDIPVLCRAIINDEWKAIIKGGFKYYAAVIYAWRDIPASSPFLRLLMDAVIKYWSPADDYLCPVEVKPRQKLPAEYLCMMISKIQRRSTESEGRTKDTVKTLCAYHEYAQDPETISLCKDGKEAAKFLREEGLGD